VTDQDIDLTLDLIEANAEEIIAMLDDGDDDPSGAPATVMVRTSFAMHSGAPA
jgi:hypothetical protein